MTRHTKQSLFLFGLVIPAAFFGAASVHAYINSGMSLEWLCTFKPVIVHAEVVSVMNRKVHKEMKFEFADVVCKPLEFLKGKAGERFEFKFDGYGPAGAQGTKYLLFLDRNDEKKLEVVYWINLDQPCARMKGVGYTKVGNILAQGSDILKLVRSEIRRNLPGHRSTPRLSGMDKTLVMSAPGQAGWALWAGSSVYFYIPPDPVFRERFHRIFRMNDRRQNAMWETAFSLVPLSYYKDDETVAILKKALSDPRSRRYRIHKGNKTETIDIYPIRQFAYEALIAAGHEVAEPEHFCKYLTAKAGFFLNWEFQDPDTQSRLKWEEVRAASSLPVRADRYGDPLPAGAVARLGSVGNRFGKTLGPMVFSPDNKTLALAYRDADNWSIAVWDVTTGKTIRRLAQDKNWITDFCFTPDGRFVLIPVGRHRAEDVIKIRIQDVRSGKIVRELETGSQGISSLAVSPDGKMIAGASGNEVLLCDFVSGKRIGSLKGHQTTVGHIAFSADGKMLLSSSYTQQTTPGTICTWSMPEGKLQGQYSQPGTDNVFSADGTLVAFTGKDNKIHIMDLDGKNKLVQLPVKVWGGPGYRFLPQGRTLLAGGSSEMICLWDGGTGRKIREFQGYVGNGIFVRAVSPDGRIAASVSSGSTAKPRVRLWDVAAGTERLLFPGHQGRVTCLAFTSDATSLLSGSWDHSAIVWEARTGKEVLAYRKHTSAVNAVAFSPDGRAAATGDDENNVHLWDPATGKQFQRLRAKPGGQKDDRTGIKFLGFSADGKRLIAGAGAIPTQTNGMAKGVITLWDRETGKELRTIKEEMGYPVALSPDGSMAASFAVMAEVGSFAAPKKIIVRRLDSGRVFCRIAAKPREVFDDVCFSPDNRLLLIDSRLYLDEHGMGFPLHRIVELASGGEVCQWDGGERMMFSPDGKVLAEIGGGDSRSVAFADLFTGREIGQISCKDAWVWSCAFSPDSRFVASGNDDNTILIWDMISQKRPRQAKLTPSLLEKLWTDLADPDAARGYKAVWKLAASPEESVDIFRNKLRPVAPVSQKYIKRLIEDLDSDQFKVRQQASEALEKLAELAESALLHALAQKPSLEGARRLEMLLEKSAKAESAPPALRASRAVAVLERAGTSEARQLLESFARGSPDAFLTRHAIAALKRWR